MKVLVSNLRTKGLNENSKAEAEAIIKFFKIRPEFFKKMEYDEDEDYDEDYEFYRVNEIDDYIVCLFDLDDLIIIKNTKTMEEYILKNELSDTMKTDLLFVKLYNKIPYNKNNRFKVVEFPSVLGEVVYHRDDYFNEWITPKYESFYDDYRK